MWINAERHLWTSHSDGWEDVGWWKSLRVRKNLERRTKRGRSSFTTASLDVAVSVKNRIWLQRTKMNGWWYNNRWKSTKHIRITIYILSTAFKFRIPYSESWKANSSLCRGLLGLEIGSWWFQHRVDTNILENGQIKISSWNWWSLTSLSNLLPPVPIIVFILSLKPLLSKEYVRAE